MQSADSEKRCPELLKHIAIEAMAVAAEAGNIALPELMSKKRLRARVAQARQIAMYLAHVVGGLSLGEVSAAFERDRTTVAYACHVVEDRRDGPMFDREINSLEVELRTRLATLFARENAANAPDAIDARILQRANLRRGA